MKTFYFLTAFLFITFSINAQDDDLKREIEYPFGEPGSQITRGVFGTDDRKEVKDAEGYEDFVRATAVMINKNRIYDNEFYAWSLRERLKRQFNTDQFADNVKFLDQPALGNCTGFLIAPGIIATAGHCVEDTEDAQQYVWVFDYTSESNFIDGNRLNFKPENIYEVESVIASKLDDETDDDYAFVRLKRQSERAPYRFRTSGKVLNNTNVNTLGSPTGLPLKFADNAVVVNNTPDNWFKSDLDAFPGNSGGPVFDQYGFVEGILVRAAITYSDSDGRYTGDYKYNSECDCVETVQWNSVFNTAGCESHRITSVPGNILITAIYENLSYSIRNGLHDRFNAWSKYSWIFGKKYNTEQNSLEFLAIQNNNNVALESILNITAKDLTDNLSRKLLNQAISNNNMTGLNILLENGAFADAGYGYNLTALQEAIINNKVEFAERLMMYDANTKVKTSNQQNLLHLAARNGNFYLTKLLVKAGVDANAKDSNRKRPEKIARKSGHRDLGKYLKNVRKGRL